MAVDPVLVNLSVAVFVVAVAALRLVFVRGRPGFDHLINAITGFAAAAVLFGEPAIARRIAGFVPGGLPMMVDIWHWCSVMAFSCALGIALRRKYGQAHYRTPFRVVIALAVGSGVLFLAMSSPGRAAGLSIVDIGGWRCGVYAGTYWVVPVVVAYCMLKDGMATWRLGVVARERAVLALLMLFSIGTLLNALVFMLAALSGVLGVDTEFAREVRSFASWQFEWGVLEAVITAPLSLVLVPSLARGAVQTLRLDSDSRTARRLYPVWRDLVAAAPDVVLPLKWTDRWGVSPAERLHRRRVEILDAAEIVARFVRPLPMSSDVLIEATVDESDQESMRTVTELVATAERLADSAEDADDEPTMHGADIPDEQVLIRLWAPATALLAADRSRASSPG